MIRTTDRRATEDRFHGQNDAELVDPEKGVVTPGQRGVRSAGAFAGAATLSLADRSAGAAPTSSRNERTTSTSGKIDAETTERTRHGSLEELVLVPMNDYRPGMVVSVVGRLPAEHTVRLLSRPDGETVPVLTRPDEYVGFVVRSQLGGGRVDTITVVFARDTNIKAGRCYAFAGDASVFSVSLRLLRATVCPQNEDENDS